MNGIILIVLLGGFLAGCNTEGKPKVETGKREAVEQTDASKGPDTETKDEVEIRIARKDEVGRAVQCPVMGTRFNVTVITEVGDYKGKSYYFCCAGCPGSFKNNPEKYIK